MPDSRLSAPKNEFRSRKEAAVILMNHYRDIVVERGGVPDANSSGTIFARCKRVISWIENAERADEPGKRGYMFVGGCGNGKSTMGEAIRRFYHHLPVPLSCMMITASELNRIASEKTADDGRFERACLVRRLIIDDLGVQQPYVIDYGNQRFPFNELLEERYNRNLITVISTNIENLNEFRSLYGARIEDRIREYFIIERVTEKSYRK